MKFGTDVGLEGWKILGGGGVNTLTHPLGTGSIKGYRVPLEPQPCVLAKTF